MNDPKKLVKTLQQFPQTNKLLHTLFDRDGELSEENAPKLWVKLCKELEADAAEIRHQLSRSQMAAMFWYRFSDEEETKRKASKADYEAAGLTPSREVFRH